MSSGFLISAIVAVFLTLAASVGYLVYFSISVTPQIIVTIIALVFLSFLASTVGFDKVKQLIEQIQEA